MHLVRVFLQTIYIRDLITSLLAPNYSSLAYKQKHPGTPVQASDHFLIPHAQRPHSPKTKQHSESNHISSHHHYVHESPGHDLEYSSKQQQLNKPTYQKLSYAAQLQEKLKKTTGVTHILTSKEMETRSTGSTPQNHFISKSPKSQTPTNEFLSLHSKNRVEMNNSGTKVVSHNNNLVSKKDPLGTVC